MRILVVDDDAAVADMLNEVVGRLGHQVDVVSSGAAALQQTALVSYDAMVLDVRMPGLSGPDIFDVLRAKGSPLVDRTVFVVADFNPEMQQVLANLGRPVLTKPFRVDELTEVLRTILNRPLDRA